MTDPWNPYVRMAERRRQVALEMQKLAAQGQPAAPVMIQGRTIARTFWGKAWCENLERYSDFSNRLPRGRTYVRNGSIVHLALDPGQVTARVRGSWLYTVTIQVEPLPKTQWKALRKDCAGAIDSVVELLQGRFAKGVMERLCHPKTGLFPAPSAIRFSCTCPDWASMCKHVAATLYGVGVRLDKAPELLFALRQVDEKDLIAEAGEALALPRAGPKSDKILGPEGLSELFGLDLALHTKPASRAKRARRKVARRGRKKAASSPKSGAEKPASPTRRSARFPAGRKKG